jgi:RNA polymerase sigma-70 factor (ECF subfamily)
VEIEGRETPVRLTLDQEAALIKRAKAGDEDAFSVLYHAYVQAVYHYLLVRLANPQVAEDLTAEVFLRVADSLPHYSDRGLVFGAWLFRIARDRLVDYYRQAAHRPVVDLDESLASETDDPSLETEQHEAWRSLQAALKQLTDEQRDVILFRYMEEWSLEETSSVMHKSVNAVKALQHRAVKALGRIMRDKFGGQWTELDEHE